MMADRVIADFGVDLSNFLNQKMSPSLAEQVRDKVIEALSKSYDLTDTDVLIEPNPSDPSSLNVTVKSPGLEKLNDLERVGKIVEEVLAGRTNH